MFTRCPLHSIVENMVAFRGAVGFFSNNEPPRDGPALKAKVGRFAPFSAMKHLNPFRSRRVLVHVGFLVRPQ